MTGPMTKLAMETPPAGLSFSACLERSHRAHQALKEAQAYLDAQHSRVGDEAVAFIDLIERVDLDTREAMESLACLRGAVLLLRQRQQIVDKAVDENTRLAELVQPTRRVKAESIRSVCAGCGKHLSGDPAAPVVSHGACSESCFTSAAERRAKASA